MTGRFAAADDDDDTVGAAAAAAADTADAPGLHAVSLSVVVDAHHTIVAVAAAAAL